MKPSCSSLPAQYASNFPIVACWNVKNMIKCTRGGLWYSFVQTSFSGRSITATLPIGLHFLALNLHVLSGDYWMNAILESQACLGMLWLKDPSLPSGHLLTRHCSCVWCPGLHMSELWNICLWKIAHVTSSCAAWIDQLGACRGHVLGQCSRKLEGTMVIGLFCL